mgnify:CR=1 FL=1
MVNLRTLEVRREVACCMFVYDVLVERLRVASLSSSIIVREPGRTLRSSSQAQLLVPFTASNYEANAVVGRCCRIFNQVFDLYDPNYSREWFRDRTTERLLSLSDWGICLCCMGNGEPNPSGMGEGRLLAELFQFMSNATSYESEPFRPECETKCRPLIAWKKHLCKRISMTTR